MGTLNRCGLAPDLEHVEESTEEEDDGEHRESFEPHGCCSWLTLACYRLVSERKDLGNRRE